LTLSSTDFRVAEAIFRGVALCAIAFAATRGFETAVLFFEGVLPLAIIFLVGLALSGALAFAVFRATVFCATARFALGRLVLALSVRLFAADFGEER
jgi:hypothetical protein